MSEWRRFSRLPQSPEYWRGVTDRVQQSVHALGDAPLEPVRSLAPLAWIALAAGIVAVVASTILPPVRDTAVSLRTGIIPADSVAAIWLDRSEPPSATELLEMQMARTP
jgi:hypothetical protein